MATLAKYKISSSNGTHDAAPYDSEHFKKNSMFGHQISFEYENGTPPTSGSIELYIKAEDNHAYKKVDLGQNNLADIDIFIFEAYVDKLRFVITGSNGTGDIIVTDRGF